MLITGDAKVSLDFPTTIYLGEPAFGRCAVNNLKNTPPYIKILAISSHCTASNVGNIYSTEQLNYQQNFTVTCRDGSAPSVNVSCFVVSRIATKRDIVIVKGMLS